MSMLIIVLLIVAGVAVVGAACFVTIRPLILRWGATAIEAGLSMDGDSLIADPILMTTRATNIQAHAECVWPWLAQMGQGRGGFYSYEWLENLAGLDIHNADRIIPELQGLKPGDLIPFWRGAGVNVVTVEPPRLLVLAGTLNPPKGDDVEEAPVGGTWVFALDEAMAQETRLVVRSRVAKFEPAWLSRFFILLLEPIHFVMERKMLRGIKHRAERQSG
jgi:hypothetical protein